MPAKPVKESGLRRELPPAVLVVVLVLGFLGIGAGIFHMVNGGWDTPAQKEYKLKHVFYPLMALRHGDRTRFDAENALRKKEGRDLLVEPVSHQLDRTTQQRIMEDDRKKAMAAGQ